MSEERIMTYVDLKMAVDTEPDTNGCMWVDIVRPFNSGQLMRFDMSEVCVRRLHEATGKFLANLDSQAHEESQP